MPDMDYWLGRKYALLQQQADAATTGAQAGAQASLAAAGLTRAQTSVLPVQTDAAIAQQRANTNLLTQQASVVVPESVARRNQMAADTGYTNTQNAVLTREGLRERTVLPESLQAVMGSRYQGFRLSPGDY